MKAVIFDYNRTIYNPDTGSLMAGAKDILDFLKNHDIKLFLIAKGDEDRREQIETLNLIPYFEKIIVNQNKSPDDFRACIKSCPSETIFFAIGDRIKEEIRLANECDMTTIWFRNGKFANEKPSDENETPDFTITKLEEIGKIVLN